MGEGGDWTCEESGCYRFLGMEEDATTVEEKWVADIAHDGRGRERVCGGEMMVVDG